jgi:hypothetical protein
MGKPKSSKKVKNTLTTLFNMHKEEANNITKEAKDPEPQLPTKKIEPFPSPVISSTHDKNDKSGFSTYSHMNNSNFQSGNTPLCMTTPGYEARMRGIEPINNRNDYYSGGYMNFFMEGKSPGMQSPSPAFTGFNRFGPETPQNRMNHRNTFQNE